MANSSVWRDRLNGLKGILTFHSSRGFHQVIRIGSFTNVVFHEFAHMLDVEDGRFDGTPVLDSGSIYQEWVRQWSAEFEEHVRLAEAGESTVLDTYGATSRAEFFAVTE